MIAGWLDWMPWQMGVALLIVMGIIAVAGTIYIMSWWYDITIGGTLDDARNLGRRFVEWRTRRRLRP